MSVDDKSMALGLWLAARTLHLVFTLSLSFLVAGSVWAGLILTLTPTHGHMRDLTVTVLVVAGGWAVTICAYQGARYCLRRTRRTNSGEPSTNPTDQSQEPA